MQQVYSMNEPSSNTAPAPDVFTAARGCLLACIRGKTAIRETRHPWRKCWEFVYFHSLRVDAICQKLLAVEAPGLPPAEVAALRMAAVLHDAGRLDDRENHARLGAQMAGAWLQARPDLAALVSSPERVVELIARHSEKDMPGPDLGCALIKDADALDEIGALSMLMAMNWLDRASPYFYYDLPERLEKYELPFCERTSALLQTGEARAYLALKQRFIESVIAQFALELEGVKRDDPLLVEWVGEEGQVAPALFSHCGERDGRAIPAI